MSLGETLICTASTTCGGETLDGVYTWNVDGGTLNTTSGDKVIYTVDEEGVFTLTVTDKANGNITATATVEAFPGICILDILPHTSLRSRWIMLPAWIVIESNCTNINFDASTIVTYNPATSILQMPFLIINDKHILQLLFVMPSWLAGEEDEFVDVVVKAGDEDAMGFLDIEMLPFPLDEQKELK